MKVQRNILTRMQAGSAKRRSRQRIGRLLAAAGLLLTVTGAPTLVQAAVTFEKRILTDRYFCDGINTGDFNRDGHMDVVAGPFWYAGPTFEERHEFYPAVVHPPEKSPSDSMFSFVHDFDQDGWPDILVCGRVHLHQAFWYRNPGHRERTESHWKRHFVFERVQGESPALTDIDGDGKPEILCLWQKRWGWIKPDWQNPTRPWSFHAVTPEGEWHHFYHGMGTGDINGDGRLDLLLNEGWWEQPAANSAQQLWIEHKHRFGEKGGAQMFAYDIDGDGDNDVISSLDAHGWGLAWFEQYRDGEAIAFRKHMIMGDRSEEAKYGVAFSQPHALDLADINRDGLPDLVVGKRLWAHGPKGDVEPNAAPVVYWFELIRPEGETPRFLSHLIDAESGVGVQVTAADINADRRPDILTVSKRGTFIFLSE